MQILIYREGNGPWMRRMQGNFDPVEVAPSTASEAEALEAVKQSHPDDEVAVMMFGELVHLPKPEFPPEPHATRYEEIWGTIGKTMGIGK